MVKFAILLHTIYKRLLLLLPWIDKIAVFGADGAPVPFLSCRVHTGQEGVVMATTENTMKSVENL